MWFWIQWSIEVGNYRDMVFLESIVFKSVDKRQMNEVMREFSCATNWGIIFEVGYVFKFFKFPIVVSTYAFVLSFFYIECLRTSGRYSWQDICVHYWWWKWCRQGRTGQEDEEVLLPGPRSCHTNTNLIEKHH